MPTSLSLTGLRIAKRATILLFYATTANLAYATDVYWAGVGFLGEYSKRHELYPHASKVYEDALCNRNSCFEEYAREVFVGQALSGMNVKLTDDGKRTNAIGLGLGISFERVIVDETPSISVTDSNIITTIAIFGSLIFMDLDTNVLIGEVPVYVTYSTASTSNLPENAVYELTRKLLTSNELGVSFKWL